MKNKTSVVAAFILLILFGLFVGGWNTYTFRGNRAFSAVSVSTSADGETVYAATLTTLYKSEDGGDSWIEVTPPEADLPPKYQN